MNSAIKYCSSVDRVLYVCSHGDPGLFIPFAVYKGPANHEIAAGEVTTFFKALTRKQTIDGVEKYKMVVLSGGRQGIRHPRMF